MLLKRAKREERTRPTTDTLSLYYASDVHGSELCWRKFLGAGRFYGVQALIMGGDLTGKAIVPVELDDKGTFRATVIVEVRHVQSCDDRIVRVGHYEMISCGYSNPTPWHTPRELDEDDLYARIKSLADQLEDPGTAIFNLHVPPHDSGLDTANEMNPDLTLRYVGGQPHPIPVGSTAVRQLIEEFQPLLSLHGHIHESRGEVRIGRTLALNTGSEYNSGHIHGAVVTLAGSEVRKHQLV